LFFPLIVADGAKGAAFHAWCVHVHEAAGRQTGRVQSNVAVRDISKPTASDRKTRRRQFRNGERTRPHQTNLPPLPPNQYPREPITHTVQGNFPNARNVIGMYDDI